MLVTRLCLATRLNCLARSLPSAISMALAGVDRLLKASVAGCAGVSSLNELTESVQDRSIASRFGGVLPGSVVISPASYVSTVAAVERSLSIVGHGHGVDGVLPSALQRVRERILTREAIVSSGCLSPLEELLSEDIAAITDFVQWRTAAADRDQWRVICGSKSRTQKETPNLSRRAIWDELRYGAAQPL
jgi:hypothetical protein